MTFPRTICIGAQKAGTSWLHENLKFNPGAWLPPFKEVHFFDHRFMPAHRKWIPNHVQLGIRSARGRAEANGNTIELAYLETLCERPLMTKNWYRRVFAPCPNDKVGIDITPEYASIPEDGVAFVRDVLGPNLRIIYLVRDPIERALSQMRMYIGRRKKAPTTTEDWNKLLAEPDLIDRGNYSAHIPRWEAIFSRESLLYIPFGQIKMEPHRVLRDIEIFSHLPEAEYPRATERVYAGLPVDFPATVIAKLAKELAGQYRFIENRFGNEFVQNCRGDTA